MAEQETRLDQRVNALAAIIREVDGKHDKGAGELAEALYREGVSLTRHTVRDACLLILGLAKTEQANGARVPAEVLIDTAQYVAGVYGVPLTLELAKQGATDEREV